MELYDIKHPLRGEEYENHKFTQPFADKIKALASEPRGFFKYKKNMRAALETSIMQSEEFSKALKEKKLNVRLELKYRLFGWEAVSDKEFKNLVK